MSKPKAMSRVMIDIETQVIQEISNLEEMILTEVPKLQEVRGEDDSTHLKVAASFFEPTQARYLFKKPLGKGASACVSLVQDVDIGRKVAIKEYKHRGDKGHRTCQKELQILGLLDHGGIPTIYDFGADEHKQYYCVMLYIE